MFSHCISFVLYVLKMQPFVMLPDMCLIFMLSTHFFLLGYVFFPVGVNV